jgi:cobalt-zinc-cadmium efflux system protein
MHDHSSHQSIDSGFISRAFIIGIILNSLFVLIEAGVGLYIHSLSLLSDAGHNLADVGSLALSLIAYRLVKIKSTEKYTYGYRKTTILAALLNAVILLISIGAIGFEAVRRIMTPVPIQGITISIVAGIGIVINGFTALMFLREKEKDINIKSAYLHLLSDAVVSLGLVAGGIVIFYTCYYWIDPLFSILIALVILFGTWNLLKESLRLSMDAVPKGISLIEINETAAKIEGIKEIHHIHCWALSTTENALTAHIVLENKIGSVEEILIKDKLKDELEHLNIKHVTLETEREDEDCGKEDCD